jgi:DNA-binding NarL/FixJ family response regulator
MSGIAQTRARNQSTLRLGRWVPRLSSLPLDAGVLIPAKILVVDDQPLVRRTLRSLLTRQSHWKIYEAANGNVALDKVREFRPDIVLLDIVMPEMNGMQVAYEIRRISPATKIIFISTYYTPEGGAHIARIFGDGCFLPKSETGRKLIPAISRLLTEESPAQWPFEIPD